MSPQCRCGHSRHAHSHWGPSLGCAFCDDCPRFRRDRWAWLRRLLAGGPADEGYAEAAARWINGRTYSWRPS